MSAVSRLVAKLLRGASAVVETPAVLPLYLRGVPPRLALSLSRDWLRDLGIRMILDVGGNTGQFALAALRVFPSAEVHVFEPLPDCFDDLRRNLGGHDRVHAWNLALGELHGEIEIERNEYSPSSSILPLGEAHRRAFPFAQRTKKVRVSMDTLDRAADRLAIREPLLIKVDVQGYEDRVLRGGPRTIARAAALLVETSFEKLYEGQLNHAEICRLLEGVGFEYRGALDQLAEPATGRILSSDSLFLRARA